MSARLRLLKKAVSVGTHSLREALRPVVARGPGDVPTSGRQITASWLSAVLCGGVPGARVEDFHVGRHTSETTDRVALHVTYNGRGREAGLPADLFVKSTASFKQRMACGGAGLLESELRFFTGLRQRCDLEAPNGYYGAVDDASWRSVVIMEDIAVTRGATFFSPTTGFEKRQILELVKQLARLHAPHWGGRHLSMLKTPADFLQAACNTVNIRACSAVGMARARDVLPAALLGQNDRLFDATRRAMQIATDGMARTLLHGDCHAGQTYVTGDGRMGLVDWQAILQGGWAFDVAYLINSGCEPEERRAWLDELLRSYIDELTRAGGTAISFDAALLAYRQQCFWPYTVWTVVIGRPFYLPEMQPVPTCLAIIRRTASAIVDVDAFAAVQV